MQHDVKLIEASDSAKEIARLSGECDSLRQQRDEARFELANALSYLASYRARDAQQEFMHQQLLAAAHQQQQAVQNQMMAQQMGAQQDPDPYQQGLAQNLQYAQGMQQAQNNPSHWRGCTCVPGRFHALANQAPSRNSILSLLGAFFE